MFSMPHAWKIVLPVIALLAVGAGCPKEIPAARESAPAPAAQAPVEPVPTPDVSADDTQPILEVSINPPAEAATQTAPQPGSELAPKPDSAPEQVRSFDMTAKKWSFEPGAITVNKGDKVRLSITSVDVAHGFSLPDFGVNASLKPNETTTVEFTADKTGTFSFFCSVFCGAGHSEMNGTLIVK